MPATEETPPKIVVLDAHTLNPGDCSWKPLETLGLCEIFPRTASSEVLSRARGAEIILTNKTVLSAEILRQLPKLRFIAVLATGTNVVDLTAASAQGVVVANVPAYSTASVAQATFALLLELVQRTSAYNRSVHAGQWCRQKDFSYLLHPMEELAGKVLGIVGYGSVGQQVARIATAFDMQVQVTTRTRREEQSVSYVELDELFRTSDIVSLHCPLTPETLELVSEARLGTMKTSALLINTSRGALIDEDALAAALEAGKLAGAGLDVLTREPPKPDNPLLRAANAIITPHIAWATRAARSRLLAASVENVRCYLAGSPTNVVLS